MEGLDSGVLDPGCLRAAAVNSSRTSVSETCVSARMQSLLVVFIVVMFLGSVTGNLLVIILVAATKTLHHVTSVLIINLAISDLLVGLGVMPFVALSLVKPGWAECFNLCLFVAYTSSVYCTASVLTLAAIALDRYHSIMDCLHYNSRWTLWRKCLVVLWIWVQAMATSSPPLLGWSSVTYMAPVYSCTVDWASSPSYTATVTILSYLMPAVIILFCYMNIVKVARNHVRRVRSLEASMQCGRNPKAMFHPSMHDPSVLVCHLTGQFVSEVVPAQSGLVEGVFSFLSTPQRPQDFQQHYQGVARLFRVILAFFLCWTPYIGIALIQATETAISRQSTLVPPCALTISYFLVLLNSDFNPLMYSLLSKRFQAALQALSQKLRAGIGSIISWGGEVDTRRLTTTRPGMTSSSDNSQYCSPIFTISTDFKHHSGVNICKLCVHEVAAPSCSTSQDPCVEGKRIEFLQVPCRTQEGGRLPFSALTMEPKATFVFGHITVKVEHAPSENLLTTKTNDSERTTHTAHS
ncbi:5-hydroxytryptamine receptor 1D [Corythoichthys intestinalis]|uniref:5-hydroxytryptamine receptor 1D n=1 Tax=Corythoichthys intestinalis TaxID=161448 RepID=UPI0025A563C6|nr:5-hydroxytryptamine receptor 1D [Corythoichthys intestinalis]